MVGNFEKFSLEIVRAMRIVPILKEIGALEWVKNLKLGLQKIILELFHDHFQFFIVMIVVGLITEFTTIQGLLLIYWWSLIPV